MTFFADPNDPMSPYLDPYTGNVVDPIAEQARREAEELINYLNSIQHADSGSQPDCPCPSKTWVGSGRIYVFQVGLGGAFAFGKYECKGNPEIYVFVEGADAAFGGAAQGRGSFTAFKTHTGVSKGSDLLNKLMIDQTSVVSLGFKALGPAELSVELQTNQNILAGGGDSTKLEGGASVFGIGGKASIDTNLKGDVSGSGSFGLSLPGEILNSVTVDIDTIR